MLSNNLLLGLLFMLSCQNGNSPLTSFAIRPEELINLITNKNQSRESFINDWKLTPCPKKSESAPPYYCVQTDAIEFEVHDRGYIIGINNLEFANYDSLKAELSRTHAVVDKQELIRQNAQYGSKHFDDITMYIGAGYDLIIATSERDGRTSFTIVGNSED